MITIKDVAEKAHVSIATVSRVLNNTRYVSPEIAVRVHQAVEELHYEHNALARNLRRNQSLTLGVIIPDSNNPFFAEVTRGVEDACFDQGYVVVLCNTSESTEKAASYLTTLYQHRAAGIIIVSPGDMTDELQAYLDKGYPIVVVDRPLPRVAADMVVSDNYGGARMAVQHLVELGHKRIAFIINQEPLETVKSRWQGAQDAMSEAGLPIDPDLIYHQGDFLPDSGYKAAHQFLRLSTPPSAIFAFNDLMAFGVLSFAYDRHIRIPEDLSIIGFDDIAISAYAVPSLTTIAQPKYELGQKVAEILLKRIQGDDAPILHLTLPTELIVRKSTAAPARLLRNIKI